MAPANRLIKKYPNRRLYDTQTSAYITLADVKQLVLDRENFKVIDAKSNEDLTRSILLQIILEEEAGGAPLFSSQMLAHMIRVYGHAMQGMMGAYMEKTLQAFIEVQSRIQDQSSNLFDHNNLPSSTELWTQFMQGQAPMMQTMMSNYVEQSKNLFFQMQEQMQEQARSVFHSLPGSFAGAAMPGMPTASPEGRHTTTVADAPDAAAPAHGGHEPGAMASQPASGRSESDESDESDNRAGRDEPGKGSKAGGARRRRSSTAASPARRASAAREGRANAAAKARDAG